MLWIQKLSSHTLAVLGWWNLRIQERGDLFLVSFESEKDKKKDLKGCAWCFDRVLVCLEVYDGITPMADVPMCHVRM